MSLYESFQKVIQSFGMETLSHPLFYNSKIAIRFNIGDNGNDVYINEDDDESDGFNVNPLYVNACLDRAKQIYNHLKSEPDLLVIEGFIYENETITDFITTVMNATGLVQPNEIKTESFVIDEDEESTHIYLFWRLHSFNPAKLLKEIIIADLETGNDFLTSSVYFVCTDNNTIFHLYDDRGADLVSDKKDTINHIYNELNDLILDYDRDKVDAIFTV